MYANKEQRNHLKNLIFEIFKAGGEITLIFAAPGAAPYFLKPYMKNHHDLDELKFNRAIKTLEKRELILVKDEDGGVTLTLTKNGEKKAIKYSLDDMKLERPEKWDGFWRLVIFDVPDRHKVGRNYFKQMLDKLGFITIQKSVYAHPFPCEDQIELIRNVYELTPFVKIIKAADFEGDEKYLARFGLNKITNKHN